MKLIDINGIPHELTPTQVRVMMAIGWISFFLSWAFNALFYKVNTEITNTLKVLLSCSEEKFTVQVYKNQVYKITLSQNIDKEQGQGTEITQQSVCFVNVVENIFKRKLFKISSRDVFPYAYTQ